MILIGPEASYMKWIHSTTEQLVQPPYANDSWPEVGIDFQTSLAH